MIYYCPKCKVICKPFEPAYEQTCPTCRTGLVYVDILVAENAALRKEVAYNEAEKAFSRGGAYSDAVAEGEKHVAELRRMAEEKPEETPDAG